MITYEQLIKSPTATRLGIDNTPDEAAKRNLIVLLDKILFNLDCYLPTDRLILNSGYRSPELNRAIGGSPNSQHCLGEAVDVEHMDYDNCYVAKTVIDNFPFDQLILENYVKGDPRSGWVHVSYREGRLRNEVLTYTGGKYLKGLVV